MEDKQKICQALLPVLQMTQKLSNLEDLEYINQGGDEWVRAAFKKGGPKWVKVTMDNGAFLIIDVIEQIV